MSISSHSLTLVRYTASFCDRWNAFVRTSKNGTFLLERAYMEYHADRFEDHSLIFFQESKIIALLPAHIQNDRFCSHNGLTYGGMILSNDTTAEITLELFQLLIDYVRSLAQINTIVYRPIPHIYHRCPSEEDLYALFRVNAVLTERKIASVVDQQHTLPFQTLRKRKAKRALKAMIVLTQNNEFAVFWKMLSETLQEKYNASPVHTVNEMNRLHNSFPYNIHLFMAQNTDKEAIAGCVIYETKQVAHVQYIASTSEGRSCGAVDLLFDYLIHTHYAGKAYFDLGTSVEEGGRMLNEGLIFQKEGFGGRAVMYDTYEIPLKK